MGSIKKPKPLNPPQKSYKDYLTAEVLEQSGKIQTKRGKIKDPAIGYVHLPDNAWKYNNKKIDYGDKTKADNSK